MYTLVHLELGRLYPVVVATLVAPGFVEDKSKQSKDVRCLKERQYNTHRKEHAGIERIHSVQVERNSSRPLVIGARH